MIQAGERDRLVELWAGVERFVWQQANRRAYTLEGYGGVTEEDLYQSGYLAMVKAVESYDPAAGMSFIGWLAFYLKTAFADAAGYRTPRARKDPLQAAASLDAPLSSDTEDIAIGDVIQDPTADIAMGAVEERDRAQRLHAALENAMASLPEAELDVLLARFFQGRTLEEISMERGVGRERVRQIEARALRRLRHPKNNRELRRYWRTF